MREGEEGVTQVSSNDNPSGEDLGGELCEQE